MPDVDKLVGGLIDGAYQDLLAKMVAAIAPQCLEQWEPEEDGKLDNEDFAKQTVDLAESLLREIGKRKAPSTKDQ